MLCFVEDWLAPGDIELADWQLRDEHFDLEFAYLRAADLRHMSARAAWLRERHIPHHQWCRVIPSGSPHFRDREAFLAAL